VQEQFLQCHQNEVKLALHLGFFAVTALRKLMMHHIVVRHLFLFRQLETFVQNHLINDVPNIKNAGEKWPMPEKKDTAYERPSALHARTSAWTSSSVPKR